MKHKLLFIAAALLAVACGSKTPGSDPKDDPSASVWKLDAVTVPGTVDVYVGTALKESFVFETDIYNRMLSLSREDMTLKKTLYSLKYTYHGAEGAEIRGKYLGLGSEQTLNASFSKGLLSFKSSGVYAAAYSGHVEDGMIADLSAGAVSPKSTYYESEVAYSETYENDGENITKVVLGTKVTGAGVSENPTEFSTERALTISYTYSDKDDLCNFNAFLMECNFPVWYAKGLPGSTKLITGMTMANETHTLHQSFTVEYEFNSDGTVKSATRKDYSSDKTTPVLTRVYKLTY